MGGRLAVGISVVWVALAFLGDGLTALVLPAAIADLAGAATAVGLISFVGLGLAVAVQPFAGRLSDKLRRKVDRRRFVLAFTIPTLGGLVVLAAAGGLWSITAAYLLVMLSASAIQAGQQTLIPEHVRGCRLGRAASLKTTFDIGGAFLAFLILGWLLETGGVSAAVVAIAIVLMVSVAILIWAVPARPREREAASPDRTAAIPAGFVPLVLSRFLFLFGIYAVGRFLLFLVADRIGVTPDRAAAETGMLLALFTMTTAVAALPLGRAIDRVGRRPLMVGGAVIGGAGTALFIVSGGLAGVVVAGLLMSIGTAAFSTANWAAVTGLTPGRDSGRLLGIANIGTGGAAACAGLLGPSIDAYGFAPSLIIATAAILLSLAPLARPVRVTSVERSMT